MQLMQGRPQLLVTWGLWGLAMLVTLAFIPVGYRVTHQVLHLSGGLGSSLDVWTRLALEVGAHLELVAGPLALLSAGVVFRRPQLGQAAVLGQLLCFFGLCVGR
jgi:hypothetical protein